MRKKFWIYKIRNTVTCKYYIGQTNDINKRISAHRLSQDKDMYIAASIAKYGWNVHTVEVLFEASEIPIDLANQIEVYFIGFHGGCYPHNVLSMNLNEGGMQGLQTKEQIERMAASKFKVWKKKIGKEEANIEVYSKTGDFLFTHTGTATELAIRLATKITRTTITAVSQALKRTGVVYAKYVIQWEGENKIGEYLLAKDKRVALLKKAPMTENRLMALKPMTDAQRERQKTRIIDFHTGEIVFDSIKEFAKHEGISATALRKRFRTNKYNGKYKTLKQA